MNKTGKQILHAGLYLVVFILIQFFVQIVVVGGYMLFKHLPLADLRKHGCYDCFNYRLQPHYDCFILSTWLDFKIA